MKKFKFLTIAVFVLGFAAVSFSAGHTTAIESKYDYKTTAAKPNTKTAIVKNLNFFIQFYSFLEFHKIST